MSDRGFILNVNDDDASRYLITRVLSKAGFDVREAGTGMEALAWVAERPRLVVLDVQLPDLSGLEVCRRIKENPATADIPVLQTSATFVTADRKVQGLESGADGYLTQPVEPTELIATVRALLRASRAEQGVRDAAIDWQRTFDALTECVLVLDGEGRIQRSNAAARRLLDPPLLEQPVDPVLTRALPAWDGSLVASVRRTRAAQATEFESGGRWLRLSADPILDDAGAIERIVLVVADVTADHRVVEQERRRAREFAEESRRKDQYLAMLAHELRNPLNAISSAATLLERTDRHPVRNQQHLAIITRQVRHLSRMVDDLLEASRLTRGRVELKRQNIDLRQVLEQAIRLTGPLVESRRQRVVTSMPDNAVPVSGDALRLEQVFVNLLNNAAKYSEPGTIVHVTCALDRTLSPVSAVVRVRDQGIGIPAEHLEDVFDVFMQIDESLARSLGGLGMGLTVARSLVEMHGGEIRASSDGIPGHGTELLVRLPLIEHAVETAEELPPPSPPPGRSLSVLVVEDNEESAELLRTLLEMWNHRVQVARDGISGIDAALSSCPDVALLDIGLPGLDGYQVASTLRSSPSTRHVYLVAITGYGKPEDRARALDAGFNYYIVKPVHFEELEQVLADFTRAGESGLAPV